MILGKFDYLYNKKTSNYFIVKSVYNGSCIQFLMTFLLTNFYSLKLTYVNKLLMFFTLEKKKY